MEQLQQHLKFIEEVDLRPAELAELRFHETPLVLPPVHLVDATASDTSVASTANRPPVVLSTILPLSRFEITGSRRAEVLELQITNSTKGKYTILPSIESPDECVVEVKLLGQHVKGSPVKVPSVPRSWSPTNTESTTITNNMMVAVAHGAWGMIQEMFSMVPQSLVIRVDNSQASPWTTLALYNTPSVAYASGNDSYPDSLAFHRPSVSHSLLHPLIFLLLLPLLLFPLLISFQVEPTCSTWKLQRENDGQVTLHVNGILIWRKSVPACYVYMEIWSMSAKAEIVQ